MDAVAELVDEWRPAAAIGLAVPGVVDEERGIAVWSENLGWRDVPFVAQISERCGLPVVLGHDVRTGALAETRIGAARGMTRRGLPVDRHRHRGRHRARRAPARRRRLRRRDRPHAGGPRRAVRLRRPGCLEAIASAAAIARRYTARSGRPAAGAAEVLAAGDPDALAVWDEALDALAAALAWIASVLAPEAVVIGGGLRAPAPPCFDPLNDRLARHLTFQRVPRLVPGRARRPRRLHRRRAAGARFHPRRHVASGGWSRRPSSTSPASPPRGARPRRASAAGDIVLVDKKGRRFHALVTELEQLESGRFELAVRPLDSRISWRTASVREVVDVWRKRRTV